jgi:pimeloyl-ACP methyl ester carboxylesterase
LWRQLKELRVPTLIIRGAQSDTFWAGAAARARRVQPKVRLEVLEGAGHLVPLERPREVAELVLSFHKSL